MEKSLVLKILGKKDSVDLDDQIYNLRDITDELSTRIIKGLELDDAISEKIDKRLKNIYNILIPISEKLTSSTAIVGYTNSKAYLNKFINNICVHIEGIRHNLHNPDNKKLIYHTNVLMDLVLAY